MRGYHIEDVLTTLFVTRIHRVKRIQSIEIPTKRQVSHWKCAPDGPAATYLSLAMLELRDMDFGDISKSESDR